jgi:hypothetical protein
MRRDIEARVAAARERKAQLAYIESLCAELVLEGKLELTGETRNGRPVYRAVHGEEDSA